VLQECEPEQSFPDYGEDIDLVFDLAGHISKSAAPSIVSAISQSDVVLVPVFNEVKTLLKACETVLEVDALGKPIILVATKLQKRKGEFFKDWSESADCKNIAEYVAARTGKDLPIVPLKYSKAYDRIFEQDCSIKTIMRENPLLRSSFREVDAQFDVLVAAVRKFEKGQANAA